MHQINRGELDSLYNSSYLPDLRLTREEDALVHKQGCVLVLGEQKKVSGWPPLTHALSSPNPGRSGTGKTSCTAMRIASGA